MGTPSVSSFVSLDLLWMVASNSLISETSPDLQPSDEPAPPLCYQGSFALTVTELLLCGRFYARTEDANS